MPRITGKAGGMVGGVRSPMGKPMNGLIKKSGLRPPIAANTMRTDISTSSARVRSAQTGGAPVKPW